MEQLERVRSGGLVVLVVGDHAPAEVGRDHLGRLEPLARNVDLPEPLTPTRLSSGTPSSIIASPPGRP
jgi:hypothetical protein